MGYVNICSPGPSGGDPACMDPKIVLHKVVQNYIHYFQLWYGTIGQKLLCLFHLIMHLVLHDEVLSGRSQRFHQARRSLGKKNENIKGFGNAIISCWRDSKFLFFHSPWLRKSRCFYIVNDPYHIRCFPRAQRKGWGYDA